MNITVCRSTCGAFALHHSTVAAAASLSGVAMLWPLIFFSEYVTWCPAGPEASLRHHHRHPWRVRMEGAAGLHHETPPDGDDWRPGPFHWHGELVLLFHSFYSNVHQLIKSRDGRGSIAFYILMRRDCLFRLMFWLHIFPGLPVI